MTGTAKATVTQLPRWAKERDEGCRERFFSNSHYAGDPPLPWDLRGVWAVDEFEALARRAELCASWNRELIKKRGGK